MLDRVRGERVADDHGTMASARENRPILPLVAHGLCFSRSGRALLRDASVTITPGSRTVVMGPNGAGKSLLLRMLHGIVTPDAGSVTWAGRPADPDIAARQAMVFQKPVLLRRSARDNIAFVLKSLGRTGAVARAQEALEEARLAHVAQSPARRLSGGEQQRLAIVRSLVTAPDVLFLDEPSANLDPASTLAVEEMIEAARAAGTKIVLVTHDIGQARRIADDVVFMSSGRVLEHTPANDFFDAPKSHAAESYLAGRLYIEPAA